MVEKFEFWRTPILVPQTFCQILFFLHICLCILKLWYVLAYTSKKCDFWHSHWRGDSHCSTTKFCQILSFHICLFWKISSVKGEWLSFAFWCPCLRRIPSFWYPQILSKFIFILSIMKISSVQHKLVNFEFWRPCLKRIPSFWHLQILSNIIFSSYLHILKISWV